MHVSSPALIALGLILTTAPALAGYSPIGTWRCDIRGAATGMLAVSAEGYRFIPPSGVASDGTLKIDGRIVHIVSGPLRDLGAKVGKYVLIPETAPYLATGDWASQLVFELGDEKSMACGPTAPLAEFSDGAGGG